MNKDQLIRLGEFIRRRRTQRGWSLDELSRRTGLSKTGLFNMETGEATPPSLVTLRRVARGLEVDESELLEVAGHLPGVKPYLRAKYGLSEPAVAEVENFLDWVRDRDRKGGGDDRPENYQRTA
jgi:transcriptional regulator with XRE-family HTH domain